MSFTWMLCSGVMLLVIFTDSVSSCPRPCVCYAPAELHCTFRSLASVPAGISSRAQRINLGFNTINRITRVSFRGLRSLELLMMHGNNVQDVPDDVFQDLVSLQILKMSYNKLTIISGHTFSNLTSLIRLYLDHNRLEFIHPDAFHGMTSLHLLHLEGNHLQKLHPSTFSTFSVFQRFPVSTLKHLYLSENLLKTLPGEMLKNMPQLENIFLNRNPWSCDCRMSWMQGWRTSGVVKCKKDRAFADSQLCPRCSSPKHLKGEGIMDVKEFICSGPSINSSGNHITYEENHSEPLPIDGIKEPFGNLSLVLSDEHGTKADLFCHILEPKDPTKISWNSSRAQLISVNLTVFFDVECSVNRETYESLWRLLAYYSEIPVNLRREIMLTQHPEVSYRYSQDIEKDALYYTGVQAVVLTRPAWLMQSFITMKLNRPLSSSTSVRLVLNTHVSSITDQDMIKQQKRSWVMIHENNQTQTSFTSLVDGMVEMKCVVYSSEDPGIQWMLPNGSKINVESSSHHNRVTVSSAGTLHIKSIQHSDAGLYYCIAQLMGDIDIVPFRLAVMDSSTPLKGEEIGNALVRFVGESAALSCFSVASPDAVVNWIFPDGSYLNSESNSSRASVYFNGTLFIPYSQLSNNGYHKCVAVNQHGVDVMATKLTVLRRKGVQMLRAYPSRPQSAVGVSTKVKAFVKDDEEASGDYVNTQEKIKSNRIFINHRRGKGSFRQGRRPFRKYNKTAFTNQRNVHSKPQIDPQKWAAILAKIREKTTKNNSSVHRTQVNNVERKNDEHSVPSDNTEGSSPDHHIEEENKNTSDHIFEVNTSGYKVILITNPPFVSNAVIPVAEETTPLTNSSFEKQASPGSTQLRAKNHMISRRRYGNRRRVQFRRPFSKLTTSKPQSTSTTAEVHKSSSVTKNINHTIKDRRTFVHLTTGKTEHVYPAISSEDISVTKTTANIYLTNPTGERSVDPTSNPTLLPEKSSVLQTPRPTAQIYPRIINGSIKPTSGVSVYIDPTIPPESDSTAYMYPTIPANSNSGAADNIYPTNPSGDKSIYIYSTISLFYSTTGGISKTSETDASKTVDTMTHNSETVDSGSDTIEPDISETGDNYIYTSEQDTSETVDNKIYNSQTVYSRTFDSETVDSDIFSSETVDSKRVGSDIYTSEKVDSETVDSNIYTRERVDSERVDSETVDSNIYTRERVDSERVDSETVDSDIYTSETVDSERVDNETVDSDIYTSERVDSETVDSNIYTRERVDSERVDSERVVSETVDSDIYTSETVDSERVDNETVDSDIYTSETVDSERVDNETVDSDIYTSETVDGERVDSETHKEDRSTVMLGESLLDVVPESRSDDRAENDALNRIASRVYLPLTTETPITSIPSADRHKESNRENNEIIFFRSVTSAVKSSFIRTASTTSPIPLHFTTKPLRTTPQYNTIPMNTRNHINMRKNNNHPTDTKKPPIHTTSTAGSSNITWIETVGESLNRKWSETRPFLHMSPRITTGKLHTVTVNAGSHVEMRCDADGQPKPYLSWTKISTGSVSTLNTRIHRFHVQSNGTFVIKNVHLQDGGQYVCMAENLYGSDKMTVTLVVLAHVPRVTLPHHRDLMVYLGHIALMECQTQGLPSPNISWVLPDGSVVRSVSGSDQRVVLFSNGTLRIKHISYLDRGVYKCIVSNTTGADLLTVRLQIAALPPMIHQQHKENQTTLDGQDVFIHCTSEGSPSPSIRWVTFRGTQIRPSQFINGNLFVLPNGTLYIRKATEKDSGNYECVAVNSVGVASRSVNVQVKRNSAMVKIISSSLQNTEVQYGQQLTLHCSATGIPHPRIIWRTPLKKIVDSQYSFDGRMKVLSNGSLIISHVSEKDAGDYLCVASNKMGEDYLLMTVKVLMKAALIQHKPLNHQKVSYGGELKMDCIASGLPDPEIAWSLPDGTIIKSVLQSDDRTVRSKRYMMFDNGTLYFDHVGKEEEGDYTCYAQNPMGKDEMKVRIEVMADAPVILNNTYSVMRVQQGETAVLHCAAKGKPSPTLIWTSSTHHILSPFSNKHHITSDGTLNIYNMNKFKTGNYTCTARNIMGTDRKVIGVEVHVNVPVIKELKENSGIIKRTALKDHHVLIYCTTEGKPIPRVTWVMPNNLTLPVPYYSQRITVHQNNTLHIRSLRKTDSGVFLCTARNDEGEAKLQIQLNVSDEAEKPQLKDPSVQHIYLTNGQSVTLNCSLAGRPQPDVTWILPDGTSLISGAAVSRFYHQLNGSLFIRQTSSSDAGQYRCVGSNIAGHVERIVTLQSRSKPDIYNKNSSLVSIINGENLQLSCQSNQHPEPKLTWTLPDGVVLSRAQHTGRYSVHKDGTLNVQRASVYDRGIYICHTTNQHGSSSLTVSVIVIAYPPRITSGPSPVTYARPGITVQIQCFALATPKPEVIWEMPDGIQFKVGIQPRLYGNKYLHPQGSLSIQSPSKKDNGLYKCTAKNVVGIDSRTTYVYVF